MINESRPILLTGWAGNIVGSPYTYWVVGGIFTVILLYTVWHLFRKPAQTKISHPAAPSPAKTATDCSNSILSKIAAMNGRKKIILFAGAGLECMPITIPINTAVCLAQKGNKCLLIDLDMKRNAAVKVFELETQIDSATVRPKPVVTMIENLYVWPAEFLSRFSQITLRQIIDAPDRVYNAMIINAPYLDGHPDRKLIASCSQYGLIFCKKIDQFNRLRKLLEKSGCKLLDEKPVNS